MRLLGVALLLSMASFASEKAAKEAFLADKKVQERIEKAGAKFRLGEAQVVFLRESCGVLGCVADYLVGAPLWDSKLNSQSTSVLAKVQLTGDSVMSLLVLPEYTTTIMVE